MLWLLPKAVLCWSYVHNVHAHDLLWQVVLLCCIPGWGRQGRNHNLNVTFAECYCRHLVSIPFSHGVAPCLSVASSLGEVNFRRSSAFMCDHDPLT